MGERKFRRSGPERRAGFYWPLIAAALVVVIVGWILGYVQF